MKYIGFLLLLMPGILFAQQTKRVLFIGNSYTYTHDLPGQLSLIASSKGDSLIKSQSTPGGYTFQQHNTNTTTLNFIAMGGWDYVVLQEQSQLPSFPDWQVEQDVYPFADSLCRKIREADSCTTPMFFMTWGRENGDASNCANFPPICTYEGMQSRLRNAYVNMANMNDAEVSPVGMVWKMVRDSFPLIDLYNADGSHPSTTGNYVSACTFYAAIYHKSPVGAAHLSGVSNADAANIERLAEFVVFDSLNIWRIDTTTLMAGFTASSDTLRNATFTNTGNGDTFFWDFGDGTTSTLQNPTHTYSIDTTVTVTLTAYRNCESSTVTQSLTVAWSSACFTMLTDTICPGDTLMGYFTSGTYVDTFTTLSCDSIRTLSLTVDTTTLQAGFTVNAGYLTASFSNTSTGADSYLWDFDDGTISTAGDINDHVFPSNDSFFVSLVAYSRCGSDTSIQLVGPFPDGIEDRALVNLQVYPNPASNAVTLQLATHSSQPLTYILYNISGQAVLSGSVTGNSSIDLSDVPEGVYVLTVNMNGQQLRKKLVVLKE